MADKVDGHFEIGAVDGEVVINIPSKADPTGFEHFKFSPAQARELARHLVKKSAEAQGIGVRLHVRDPIHIQIVHDAMETLSRDREMIGEENWPMHTAHCAVLCWILRHEGGRSFGELAHGIINAHLANPAIPTQLPADFEVSDVLDFDKDGDT